MTTPRPIKSIGRSPSRLAVFLVPLVLVCFALSPVAQAKHPTPTPTPTPTSTPAPERQHQHHRQPQRLPAKTAALATAPPRTLTRLTRSRPGRTTLRTVGLRSLATPQAATTRPTVFRRSLITPPASKTRPTVFGTLLKHHRQRKHGQRCSCAL